MNKHQSLYCAFKSDKNIVKTFPQKCSSTTSKLHDYILNFITIFLSKGHFEPHFPLFLTIHIYAWENG